MRPVYFSMGWLFFGLGVLGVVLPVLPTTPFMLLALWAFSKSSERFHGWLYRHRLFGPPLQQWDRYRVIPLKAKVLAVSVMAGSLFYLLMYSPVPVWAQVGIAALIGYGAWFVLTKPSRSPGPAGESNAKR